jgi:ankyrin repeat protein
MRDLLPPLSARAEQGLRRESKHGKGTEKELWWWREGGKVARKVLFCNVALVVRIHPKSLPIRHFSYCSDTSSLADENEEVSNISSGSRDNHDFTRKQSREKKARERKNGTDSSSIVSLSSSSLATAARSLKKRLKKGFWFRQKRTYGPPYHEDYGGDLIEECNKFFASAKEVHEMLCNGADPNIENESEHGLTALHYAARYGNIGILEMLVEAGGDVNHATPMGLTPLAAACMFPLEVLKTDAKLKQRQLDTIQWLLDRGVTVDVVDKGGFTPLTWACRSGLKEAVVSLVEAGADVMQRRPALPKGSQVCIPKVDVLSPVTVDDEIRAYIMEKIDEILAREEEERFNRKRDETAQKMKQKVHGVSSLVVAAIGLF